ncbi:MAG: RNA polymerase sigma factor, partial [Brevinema sp.]
MGKFEELSPRARELFEEGYSQKEIAKILNVSETTLVEWKKKYEGSPFDWEERRQKATQNKKNVTTWLEEQIQETMLDLESDMSNEVGLKRLDTLISMKKKYDGAIDKLGETSRVMSAFAGFV